MKILIFFLLLGVGVSETLVPTCHVSYKFAKVCPFYNYYQKSCLPWDLSTCRRIKTTLHEHKCPLFTCIVPSTTTSRPTSSTVPSTVPSTVRTSTIRSTARVRTLRTTIRKTLRTATTTTTTSTPTRIATTTSTPTRTTTPMTTTTSTGSITNMSNHSNYWIIFKNLKI